MANQTLTQDQKAWGVISYLWILSLVALAAKKNDSYVRFHANQGVLLFVISFVGLIPVLGWLVSLIVAVTAIIAMVKAYNGEKWQLPLLAGPAKEFGAWLEKTLKL
ncbi:MAG: hypothetical protein WCT16_03135 [Candidatus Buchananbacteria bacterium]